MARRFGVEGGTWHRLGAFSIPVQAPRTGKALRVPVQLHVQRRDEAEGGLLFAAVQSPRKLGVFSEGLRGDRRFLGVVRQTLRDLGARRVHSLHFTDDSDLGTESSIILEGEPTLPAVWSDRLARRRGPARTAPRARDVRVGQRVTGAQLDLALGESEWIKVAGRPSFGDLFFSAAHLTPRQGPEWELPGPGLVLVVDGAKRSRSPDALEALGLKHLRGLEADPDLQDALGFRWRSPTVAFSLYETFAKPLKLRVDKLEAYARSFTELLAVVENLCPEETLSYGAWASEISGRTEPSTLVRRLEAAGWRRDPKRSGADLQRGYHFFRRGTAKLTVGIGSGRKDRTVFHSGWVSPVAPRREPPYLP